MSPEDQEKNRGFVVAHHHESYPLPPPIEPPRDFPAAPPPPPYYETFPGVSTYPPSFGFPQRPQYYSHGYQSVPGYAVADGRPMRDRPLACCGIGLGWCLYSALLFFSSSPQLSTESRSTLILFSFLPHDLSLLAGARNHRPEKETTDRSKFILGFFCAGIPWYFAAIILISGQRSLDAREKPGYVLYTIASVLVMVAIVLGVVLW